MEIFVNKKLNFLLSVLLSCPLYSAQHSDQRPRQFNVDSALAGFADYVNSKGENVLHILAAPIFSHATIIGGGAFTGIGDEAAAERVDLFVEKGVSFDHKSHNGQTPLHYAVQAGKEDLVKKFLQYETCKTIIDAKDNEGNTALHLAAYNRDVAITSMLLAHDADAAITNTDGYTALGILTNLRSLKNPETLKDPRKSIANKYLIKLLCPYMGVDLLSEEINYLETVYGIEVTSGVKLLLSPYLRTNYIKFDYNKHNATIEKAFFAEMKKRRTDDKASNKESEKTLQAADKKYKSKHIIPNEKNFKSMASAAFKQGLTSEDLLLARDREPKRAAYLQVMEEGLDLGIGIVRMLLLVRNENKKKENKKQLIQTWTVTKTANSSKVLWQKEAGKSSSTKAKDNNRKRSLRKSYQ